MKPLLLVLALSGLAAHADEGLRALSTNRPSKTEVPVTVDAGHLQIESDFANFATDQAAGVTTRVTSLAATNLRYGLTPASEAEVTFSPYFHQTVRSSAATRTQNGPGDTVLAVKHNWFGNNGGTAVGTLAYFQVPTNQDHLASRHGSGGLLLPVGFDFPNGFSFIGNVKWEDRRNSTDTGYVSAFEQTLFLARSFTPQWGAYVELFSDFSAETGSQWVSTFDLGVTYLWSANLQLDVAANLGLTKAAPDLNVLTGISYRL